MNSMVIDGARGVNRLEAFLDSTPGAGLHEVNLAELEAVEGGCCVTLYQYLLAGGLLDPFA